MSRFLRILIIAIAALCILSLLGCPGKKGINEKKSETGKEVNVNGQPVEVPADQLPENTGQGSGGPGSEETVKGPVTGYTPTKEEPLAPPAPPASGSETVKEGEMKFIASATGASKKQEPLISGAKISAGDNVKVQVSLVNKTAKPYAVKFMTSQKLDVIINDLKGKQVYKWSEGLRFAQVVNELKVEAGDTWSHELTIQIGKGERQLPPGTYNVVVMLLGEPGSTFSAQSVTISQEK